MFKKTENTHMLPHSSNQSPSPSETIIGPSVKLEGEVKSEGNIVIEGSVQGTVKTKNNLQVGKQAQVRANIEAANAFIAGRIEGSINVKNKLELGPEAVISGDVTCNLLHISEGASLNGNVSMQQSEKGKQEPASSPANTTKLSS